MQQSQSQYVLSRGQRLRDYNRVDVMVEEVASGGMGIVAFGINQISGRWIALKTMQPDLLAQSPKLRDLFIRESLIGVGLWPHANILLAQAVTEIDGLPFLVLDYAELGSLRILLNHVRPHLPLDAALYSAQQVAAGLVALHTPDPQHLRPAPIVHRDLKPENLLVRQLGEKAFVQIMDFGLAKAVQEAVVVLHPIAGKDGGSATITQVYRTQKGAALGTPAYMPPEQWDDAGAVNCPADIYAFGQILSELITGHLGLAPTDTSDPIAWYHAHTSLPPRPLRATMASTPVMLEELYRDMLAKEPGQRPTAAQVLERLNAVAREIGTLVYAPPEVLPHTIENEANFWHDWSTVYAQFEIWEEAMMRADRVLALVPNDPDILNTRATILAGKGQWREALDIYEQALTLYPSYETKGHNMVYNQMGILLGKVGRYGEADRRYVQAQRLMPEDALTWSNRAENERWWAMAEAQAGRIAEARQHVTQGIAYATHSLQMRPNARNTQGLLAMLIKWQTILGGN